MNDQFPFLYRVALLVGLMALIAAFDLGRNGRSATKWQEYAFILFTGVIGSVVGALNDLVTSSISPEYFTLGKGLAVENLTLHAALFGLKVGFSAGAVAGGACLLAGRGKAASTPVDYRYLYRRILWLIPGAVVIALVLPLAASGFDPFGFSAQLRDVITPERIAKFRLVWWVHTGLYAGLLLGLVWAVCDIVRRRRSGLPAESGS